MESSIWDQVLARVETKVNRHSFYTWFRPTSLIADSGSDLTVRGSHLLFTEWLTKHYTGVLTEALEEVKRPGTTVAFVAEGNRSNSATEESRGDGVRQEDPDLQAPSTSGGLTPRYTFDTFIVGPSNQFAHAACRAVAEMPSRSYNPLFIYGGVGLGKTHLMHAIGQYVLLHDPSLTLTYISSERF